MVNGDIKLPNWQPSLHIDTVINDTTYRTWLYKINSGTPAFVADSAYEVNDKKIYGVIEDPQKGLLVDLTGIKNLKYGTSILPGTGGEVPTADVISRTEDESALSKFGNVRQHVDLDTVDLTVGVKRTFFNDGGFSSDAPTSTVVEIFETRSGLTSTGSSQAVQFDYKKTGHNPEFNYSLQSPQFEVTEISGGKVVNDSFVSHQNGKSVYTFYVDRIDSQLTTTGYTKIGRVKYHTILRDNGSEMSVNTYSILPVKNEDIEEVWPDAIQIDRTNSMNSKSVAENNSSSLVNTNHYQYNNKNGSPHFTEKVFNDGTYLISQSIFNSNQLPDTTFTYFSSSYPDLQNADSSKALPTSSTLKLTGATRIEYDSVFTYKVKKTFTLKDIDTSLTDDSLKAGVTPSFTHVGNLNPSSEIFIRDEYGQPVEMASYKNDGVVRYLTTFYGGKSALPIGVVNGAPYSDCMILTMENAAITGLTTVDLPPNGLPGRLGVPSQNLSYSTEQAHTGEYSVKIENTGVLDAIGFKLKLKNVFNQKYGYIISAWIYAESGTPNLEIELFKAGDIYQRSYTGSPIEGSVINGKWQRWERVVTYDELTQDSMFLDPDDYAKISVHGTTVKIYVDDISAYPTNSSISMSTYNSKRQLTSTIDDNHLTSFMEYSKRGGLSAVKDEKLRVISQSGINKLGENE